MSAELRSVKNFPQLLRYLRDELLWPIETTDAEEVTFEYTAADFSALAPQHHVEINKILQLRPLVSDQPWGIFYVEFKKARLPVVVLRELLASLVFKKRASANKAERPAWECHDLLFISSYGEDAEHRHLNFAHFSDNPNGSHLPALRVLDWDEDDTDRTLQRLDVTLHEKLKWPEDDSNLEHWREQWSAAFRRGLRYPIKKAAQLALALAALAKNIRGSVLTQIAVESEKGKLRTLHAAFRSALIHDLEEKQFADMFAQTVAYGLFTNATRRTVPGGGTAITADGTVDSITSLSPFLRDLLDEFLSVSGRRRGGLDYDKLGVNEVVDLLNAETTDLRAVLDDFGHKKRDEDPVIHFYETFLAAYDKDEKIKRGVFYTPQPVVSYIVRSVHELLQTEFGLPHGLAATETWGEMIKKKSGLSLPNLSDDSDPARARLVAATEFFVQVLDPATGTATFLVETIGVIHQHLQAAWNSKGGGLSTMPEIHVKPPGTPAPKTFADFWNLYVPTSLLPRLYGYELMMAPYAIAHMKLALKLADTGFTAWKNLTPEDRVHIYLTNALEPKMTQLPQIGFEALADEAGAVNRIKWDKRFTVVIGNPPYSGESANNIPWVRDLVKSKYEYIDGIKIEEKGKKNWLLNDYVKFMRLAHSMTEKCQFAVIGLITPHSFLDNPTFRGLRYALLKDFKLLFLLDLHGNYDKREKCPDGSKDENVFDITQGVAISVFLRNTLPEVATELNGKIYLSDLWGLRDSIKYPWLLKNICRSDQSTLVLPDERFYFFKHGGVRDDEYESWWPLNRLFQVNGNGVITAHDHFSIAFNDDELADRLNTYINPRLSDAEVLEKLELRENSMWKISDARASLKRDRPENRFVDILYRPFDVRRTFYHKSVVFNLRLPVMKHMVAGGNVALICSRMTKGETFAHAFVSRTISEAILLSSKTSNNAFSFPVNLKDEDDEDGLFRSSQDSFRSNISPKFITELTGHCAPDGAGNTSLLSGDVFNYIYALLHSPAYRNRYAEFLKTDFPRLPLTGDMELFGVLAQLGSELTALHLLESPKLTQPITEFVGGRNPEVEKISWSKETVWVDKAKSVGFTGVCEEVWNFHIGGYQVCETWLKYRKGRNLSANDRTHYQRIIVALSETIRLMKEIDAAIEKHGGWPDAFITTRIDSDLAPDAAQTYPPAAPPDLGSKNEDELPLG